MKSKVINLLKGIFIVCVFAITLHIANTVLMHKSEDGYDQIQSYYKQIDNTVDVLFLGSSKIYCQIDTGLLWDEHGISSFDLGGAEAPPWNSYYFLKEALKTQKPKVIFYDATIIGFRQDVLYQPEVWSMTNNYGMHWNINRIKQIRENAQTDDLFKKLLFPLDTMHSRYKELTKNDFVDENNTINYKGFDYRDGVREFERPDVSSMTESFVFDQKHEEYLRAMFQLSKENNIPFIVMITPYVVKPEHQGYFNYVEDICNEEGITYIDFDKMYDELGIDFSTDMAENIHLNFSGTRKLTEYLGNYIVDNFEVEDHRGDPIYSSWDIDAAINRKNRLKAEDIDEYMQMYPEEFEEELSEEE